MRRRFMSSIKPIDVNNYLTIEALEDDLDCIVRGPFDIEYCVDGDGKWKKWPLYQRTREKLKTGQTYSLRGHISSQDKQNYTNIVIRSSAKLLGNCMSIVYGDYANQENNLPIYAFYNLFINSEGIEEVSNNFLPATTLASSCYENMFRDCTSLTTAPELPATTLTRYCYENMFRDCTSLNYIKMLATDISATNCLSNWVRGVASTGTFVKNSAMNALPTATSDNYYEGIPSGWTVKTDEEESVGKIKNTGRISVSLLNSSYIEWDYPVASRVFVTIQNNMNDTELSTEVGASRSFNGLTPGPGETSFTVSSIEPNEDDTYVYEVIVTNI